MKTVSTINAEHYLWGQGCDGWRLLQRDDLSVIQERVPAGKAEVMHYHEHARQFFYILEGQAQMAFEDQVVLMQKGVGIEIPPLTKHRFENMSDQDVLFLVISSPKSQGDRIDLE
jgi:mannose-6-phosphate isomerase-like protein (cupin superfamily)